MIDKDWLIKEESELKAKAESLLVSLGYLPLCVLLIVLLMVCVF